MQPAGGIRQSIEQFPSQCFIHYPVRLHLSNSMAQVSSFHSHSLLTMTEFLSFTRGLLTPNARKACKRLRNEIQLPGLPFS